MSALYLLGEPAPRAVSRHETMGSGRVHRCPGSSLPFRTPCFVSPIRRPSAFEFIGRIGRAQDFDRAYPREPVSRAVIFRTRQKLVTDRSPPGPTIWPR